MIRKAAASIRTLILSNENYLLRYLPAKAGIQQITYLPEQAELLHTEDENFARYDRQDLRTNPYPVIRRTVREDGRMWCLDAGTAVLFFRNFPWEQLRHCPGIIRPRQLPGRYPEGRGSESVRAAAGISSVHEKQIRLEDETLLNGNDTE